MILLIGENLFSPMNQNSTCMEHMAIRIWCQSGTQLNRENIQTTKKFGGGNIMVWDV
jgi:hypothetical protein